MKVSVIIPAYSLDRKNDLQEAINSVLVQTYKPDEVIIAVDHNEKLFDELQAMGKDSVRAVLNAGTIGGAETRNAGIRSAQGDIVVFIDDDAVAEKDWLENLLTLYGNPEVLAVGGKTVSVWDNGRPRWFPEELDWLVGGIWKGHPEEMCEVRNLIGPNMSFRRSVCDKIGYMRAELGALGSGFRAGDETEFYIRLKHHFPEGKIMFEPRAIVYHKVYPSKATFKQLYLRSYSFGYYKSRMAKILSSSTKQPFSTESSFLKHLLFRAIPSYVLKGKMKRAGAILVSVFACGIGYLRGAFDRKETAAQN